jgi:hypothetical protein
MEARYIHLLMLATANPASVIQSGRASSVTFQAGSSGQGTDFTNGSSESLRFIYAHFCEPQR